MSERAPLPDLRALDEEAERANTLTAIAREGRYRDALWEIRSDMERLQGLVTLSARSVVASRIFATIDRTLDIGGGFGGLPEPESATPDEERRS